MKEVLYLSYTSDRDDSRIYHSESTNTHITLTEPDFDAMLLRITDFLKAVGYEFPEGTTLGVVASDEKE